MSERTALVLGGTGMLKGCADELLAQGWQVVLPSRRPDGTLGSAAKAALRGRGHVPHVNRVEDDKGGQRVAVAADWARPRELADRVREVMERPADLLVAWVHASYRDAVLRAVAPLLAPHAPVVEVHDSGAIHAVRGVPDPALDGHPTQQVVLGFVRHGGSTRWLSHEEASVGVLEAVHRALDGRPPSVHQVGEVDTWVMRH
jgi:NAD(P)-dependent dehydrogenase (short-subunit alcohol dehydrogenase family)